GRACAGEFSAAHSLASGNPVRETMTLLPWVPAFAGTSGPSKCSRFRDVAGTPAQTSHIKFLEMPADFYFALTLVVKMAITAGFVLAATITAERAGPLVAGLVATLPISAGPAYVFLALDHDAHFIAQSAVASLAVNAAN